MLVEEPPKLTRPNAESFAQRVDVCVVEHTVLDQTKGTRHGARRFMGRGRATA